MHNRPATPKSRRPLVVGLAILVVMLAVLPAGYYAYWRYVAAQLTAGIEQWAADQRAQGGDVRFVWSGISGFPFSFKARFHQPQARLHLPGAELEWGGSFLAAEMAPWNLRSVRVASPGQHVFRLRSDGQRDQWRLIVAGLSGTLRFFDTGALREIDANLQLPDITRPDGVAVAAHEAKMRLQLPDQPPADYSMPFATVGLELSQLLLPSGTRLLTTDPVERASFDAVIKGPVAAPADVTMSAPLAEFLAAWRDAGGVVELSSFAFAQGPLALTGNATVALDRDLQPEGAGTVTAAGLSNAVEILIDDGRIPPDRALMARTTVKALEKPSADGRPQATVGLSLQNRAVSFGPVPLLAVPRIEWP